MSLFPEGKPNMRRALIYVFLVSIVTFTLTVSVAYADCYFDGQRYRTGERVGPFVCMPDGTWRRP